MTSKINISGYKLYLKTNVSPLSSHRYRLKNNIDFGEYVVPFRYTTNGADIPRILWPIVPPNDSNILPAVIAHDYLCDVVKYVLIRYNDVDKAMKAFEYANGEFLRIMKILRINKLKRYYLYTGVELYRKFFLKRFLKVYLRKHKDDMGRIHRILKFKHISELHFIEKHI